MERYCLLHPLGACTWRVRLNIEWFGHLRIRFASDHPSAIMKLVSAVVRRYYVQQQKIFCPWIKSCNSTFNRRKHSPRVKENNNETVTSEWCLYKILNRRSVREIAFVWNRLDTQTAKAKHILTTFVMKLICSRRLNRHDTEPWKHIMNKWNIYNLEEQM